MQQIQQILVTTDFSASATDALIYGTHLSCCANFKLHVLHVVDGKLTPEQANEKLEELAHHYFFGRKLKYELHVRQGGLLREIHNFVEEQSIDLLIIGMRGANSAHESLLGSLAISLIDDPPCALLGIPKGCRVLTHKAVVFATDLKSVPPPAEMYPLLFLTEAFQPKVHVLHVNAKGTIDAELLEEKFADLFPYNLKAFEVLRDENVVQAINTYAKTNNIDLITLLHHTTKNLAKRSITKQYSFVGETPLLVIPTV